MMDVREHGATGIHLFRPDLPGITARQPLASTAPAHIRIRPFRASSFTNRRLTVPSNWSASRTLVFAEAWRQAGHTPAPDVSRRAVRLNGRSSPHADR